MAEPVRPAPSERPPAVAAVSGPDAAPPAPGPPAATDPVFGPDPVAFLDRLVAGGVPSLAGRPPAVWFDAGSVPRLLARMDSVRPCPHIVASKSSMFPRSLTTEGEMAMYLLACVRMGRMPLGLGSHQDSWSRDPEDYRGWWRSVQRLGALTLPRGRDGHVDWRTCRPADLLAALRRYAGSAVVLPESPPFGWINAADAADLMQRIRSRRPLACVVFHGHAPAAPPAPSDEGATARMLLHLYRESRNGHHPRLTTPAMPGIESDPEAWERWWAGQAR